MADSYVTLNTGSGGSSVDTESITFGAAPTTRHRSRIVITGTAAAAIADVTASVVTPTGYGLPTRPIIERAATATQATVASSASSVTIQAANTSRRKLVVINDSASATLYLRFNASAATTANHTYQLLAGETLIEDGPGLYTGEVRGIWSAAVGNARVTEFT
jgi:hypothetical protein